MPRLEAILSPGEFAALHSRDLSRATCVVFDILRATTSMVTALANGAVAIVPVGEISEALALRAGRPEVLLAGERHGLRIRGDLTGGIDFDLGNSPREFTRERVAGRTLVMTTTNGTRALRACAAARRVQVASFLNLAATVRALLASPPEELILVCSGTVEEPALEDILAAGAVCEEVWPMYRAGHRSDGAEVARRIYASAAHDLPGAMNAACNGRRLLALPDLRDDVPFCLQRDVMPLIASLTPRGTVEVEERV